MARDCPLKKKRQGNGGKSLTLIVGVNESTSKDGEVAEEELGQSGQIVLKAAEIGGASVDTLIQENEDSVPVPQTNKDLPADETEAIGSVLLCTAMCLNGIEVTFLVDSGACEWFISAIFAEQNDLKMRKTKEKLKI